MKAKRNRTSKKKKADAWFIPVRGSYLPARPAGWATYIPFIGYLVFSSVVSIKMGDNLFVSALWIAPNWIAATAVMTYLAARKS